jgi:hypothetical protein
VKSRGEIVEAPAAPDERVTAAVAARLDLTDEEKRALIALLKRTLEYVRYPLAPRLDPLKAILAKLEPSRPPYELPPPLPAAGPRVGRGRRRR